MYNTIFFDMDGTLVDSELAIVNAAKHALMKQFGIQVNDSDRIMKTLSENFVEGFMTLGHCTRDEVTDAIAQYRDYYSRNSNNETTVYKGIPELLASLTKEKKKLILATIKPIPVATKVLEYFDLTKYFDFISGSNLDGTRHSKIEVIQYAIKECKLNDKSGMVMIGDTKHDIEGAKGIGIDSIGVTYGVGSAAELKDATFVVGEVIELENLLVKPLGERRIYTSVSKGLEF